MHLARKALAVIIRLAGQAPSRRQPLSSNVRQHTEAMRALASAAGRQSPPKTECLRPLSLAPVRTMRRGPAQAPQLARLRSGGGLGAAATSLCFSNRCRKVSQLGRLPAAGCAFGQRSWSGRKQHLLFQLPHRRACAQSSSQGRSISLRFRSVLHEQCCLTLRSRRTSTGMALGPRAAHGLCCTSRPKHHAGSGPLSSNVRHRMQALFSCNRGHQLTLCLLALLLSACANQPVERSAERSMPESSSYGKPACPRATYISPEAAAYPRSAANAGYINGWVLVELTIAQGEPTRARVLDSSPSLFEAAALKGAKSMRFEQSVQVASCVAPFRYQLK